MQFYIIHFFLYEQKNANQLFGRYLKLKNRLKEENVITLLAVE